MELIKKGKKIILLGLVGGATLFLGANIFHYNIKFYDVDIQDKSPLFPYSNYDYMTVEETFYSINGKIESIPAFFRTDFASIPKVLWFIDAPYKASFVYPAIWHDFYYTCPGKIPRKNIDDVFYHLLRAEGNSVYTSLKMYIAVRMFGFRKFSANQSCDEVFVQQESNEEYYKRENPDE